MQILYPIFVIFLFSESPPCTGAIKLCFPDKFRIQFSEMANCKFPWTPNHNFDINRH